MVDPSTTASAVVPAATMVTGSGVFPAASVRGAVLASASSAGVATAAAALPPDGVGGTAAA